MGYIWLPRWLMQAAAQALADALGIRVAVLTSFPGSDFVEILPADEKLRTSRSLYVSFWAEVSCIWQRSTMASQ